MGNGTDGVRPRGCRTSQREREHSFIHLDAAQRVEESRRMILSLHRVSERFSAIIVIALISFLVIPSAYAQPGPINSEVVWQRWVGDPRHNALAIGEPSYRSMYDHLLWFMNKTKKDSISFIDVGCAVGDYLTVMQQRTTKPIHSIGIDPVDWPNRVPYETFLQVAIAKDAKEKVPFHLYGSSDLASSSLRRLKKENVTHNQAEEGEKFFHPAPIEGDKGNAVVRTIPLSEVFEKYNVTEYVDLLKVDTQGTDLEVVLSAGAFLNKVLFLQIESILSNKPGQLLYDEQTTFLKDRAELEKRGFEVFNIAAFPAGPEGDVLFVNKKLFLEIAKRDGVLALAK